MSKYYKAEDTFHRLQRFFKAYAGWEKSQLKIILDDIPTIEVSEDNAIRIVENECFRDDLSKEIKDYLFSDLRHKLYHEQVAVSEDCISREKVAERLAELWETEHPEKSYSEWLAIASEWCNFFPSVVPTTEKSSIDEKLLDSYKAGYEKAMIEVSEAHPNINKIGEWISADSEARGKFRCSLCNCLAHPRAEIRDTKTMKLLNRGTYRY